MEKSRIRLSIGLILLCFNLTGCDKQSPSAAAPNPMELQGDEIGYYCRMHLSDHNGPKGQIFLDNREQPLWFSSVRDTLAFTLLPEEPKNISAVYVSDMGRASWDRPEPGTWVAADRAWYVIGGEKVGGMGAPEPVPFAQKAQAESFQASYGGRVVGFSEIPQSAVLGSDLSMPK